MNALGLDLSCSSTGIVALTGGEDRPAVRHEETVAVKTRGLQRCIDIANRVIWCVEAFRPDRIMIEGYGGRFAGSLIPLVELGTVVRFRLHEFGRHWYDVPPKQLKLFVAGDGNADKRKMMASVAQRWGHEAHNNDTADAYGLACIGLGCMGRLRGMDQTMLEICGVQKRI